jgi:SAM-dependent methyltransferase
MLTPPAVFLSYSRTKSANAALTDHLVGFVRERLRDLRWEIVDPMTESSVGSVREKVEQALRRADAMIVEATANTPNLLFEAGFARAPDYPTLFLINPSAFDEPALHAYFNFIGQSEDRPLPADVGDVQYLDYPASVDDTNGWRTFDAQLADRLAHIGAILTTETRMLRRNAKAVLWRSHEFARRHPPGHPITGLIGSRLGMLVGAFEYDGENVFETDSANYRGLLTAFADAGGGTRLVRAIADLSSTTETFWKEPHDPLRPIVNERTFLVPWAVLFNPQLLDEYTKVFDRQAQTHPVRVGRAGAFGDVRHPLGDDAVGADLLLMPPDLVGGYVRRHDKTTLRLERSPRLYEAAERYYERARENSVEFKVGQTPAQLRRAWMELEQIGQWQAAWSRSVSGRPGAYFAKYDLHIRSWVPDYDGLIHYTAAAVQYAVSQRIRESDRELRVLEIGYGTGALTRPLLQWIRNLNLPYVDLSGSGIVSRVYGIDAAEPMRQAARDALRDFGDSVILVQGTAPDDLPVPIVQGRPYDVVCGSLVLYDMMDSARPDRAVAVLRSLAQLLTPGGRLVFGDVFVGDDPQRGAKEQRWRAWMQEGGLTEAEVQPFIDANPELLNAISPDQLATMADDAGLELVGKSRIPGADEWSPFQIVTLRKRQ